LDPCDHADRYCSIANRSAPLSSPVAPPLSKPRPCYSRCCRPPVAAAFGPWSSNAAHRLGQALPAANMLTPPDPPPPHFFSLMPPCLKRSLTSPITEFSLVSLSPLSKDRTRPRPSPPCPLVQNRLTELGQIAIAVHSLHREHHSVRLSLQIIEPHSTFYFSSSCRS
jgi:hypothetical protein